jgi:hypothetical protein
VRLGALAFVRLIRSLGHIDCALCGSRSGGMLTSKRTIIA